MKPALRRKFYSAVFSFLLIASAGWLLGCEWEDPTLKTLKTCVAPTAITTVGVSKSSYTYALVTSAPADIKGVLWKVQQGNTVLKQTERTDTTAFSHTFATSGTYNISAEIETVCGEKITRTITTATTIKTCVLPSAIVATRVNGSTYRYSLTTATPADVKGVVWKVLSGSSTLATQPRADTTSFSYTFADAGTFTVSAEIESVCGEKITRTVSTTAEPGISSAANLAAWKIGGAGDDIGRSVAVDAASNAYVAGTYGSAFSFGAIPMGVAGGDDIFIVKYNSRGDGVWIQRITGSGIDVVKDIVIDASGDIIVTGEVSPNAGYFSSPDDVRLGNAQHRTVNGNSDVFLAKYNRDGGLIWFKTYGGGSSEIGTSIALHSSGIYLTGVFGYDRSVFGSKTIFASGTEGKNDMFLVKVSNSGDVIWAVSSGGFESDYASSIVADANGNVYMTGSFVSEGTFRSASGAETKHSSNVSPDMFIAKYDSFGNLAAFHRPSSGTFVYGNSLAINNGALYATGIIGGGKYGSISVDYRGGGGDVFVAKYNLSTLNVEWVRTAGGPGFDAGNKLVFDNAGNLYLAGLFNDNCQFGTTTVRSAGDTDAFLAQYDASGNFRFVKTLGGSSSDGFNGMAVNGGGNQLYAVGFFKGNVGSGSSSLSSSGGLDVLITRYPD